MKIGRVVCSCCLLLVSLLTIYLPGAVLAQDDTLHTLALAPLTERYNTEAIAGKDNHFFIEVESLGTAAIDNINFSSDNPTGWTIDFSPDKIDLLEAGDSQIVDINIKPPTATRVGDYIVTFQASGEQASAEDIDIRVTVKSPVIEEKIELASTYPTLEDISGARFEFEVGLKFRGSEARDFDLVATAPQGWSVSVTPQYERDRKILGIRLEPSITFATKVKVIATPPFWPLSEPGDYQVTLEITSGDLTGTTELTAVITALYTMSVVSSNARLDTKVKAGQDNFFSMEVQNLGTDAIENIKFSSVKPSGWTIEFTPDKIDSLPAIDFQTVDVNIKPPTETIAGDYEITIRISGEQASDEIKVRVTVETPTIWGWVGVAIIVLVIGGLVYIFMRLSRR